MSHVLFPQPIGLDGYQTLLGSCSDVEQLRVSNGNLVRRYTVANIATVGPSLSLVLTHNSIDNFLHPTMPAGRNWRHIAMANLAFATNLVTFTDEGGRLYDYVPDGSGSGWKRHGNSLFLPMDLSQVGSNWHLAGLANGNTWIFNAQGQLISIVDSHNQALTFNYTANRVTSITEPTGRSLTLAYDGSGRLSSITDPRNQVTSLGYDSHSNLTSITGPEGCQISYGYAPGSTNGLIVSRTDALNNSYSYTYTGGGSLSSITNPASHTLSYSYAPLVKEFMDNGHVNIHQNLSQTLLTDAHNQVWEYRFDFYQNLWRIIDPLQHTQQFYWSQQQQLLSISQGYQFKAYGMVSARPHLYNRLERNVFDSLGNQTLAVDANGIIHEMEYDAQSRLVATTPARATLAVGGEWLDHFGKDGFLLCAAQDLSSDLWQSPTYVASSGILNGDDQGQKGFIRASHVDSAGVPFQMLLHDSRAPWICLPGDPPRNTYRRTLGKWRTPDTTEREFNFRIPVSQTGGFNLSFYSHCLDQDLGTLTNERYYQEFFGRDLEFTVVDRDPDSGNPRTQTFRLPNNAAGLWVTFSVYQVANSNISVKVTTHSLSGLFYKHPAISCIAFDPLDSRRTSLSYDPSNGDLLGWKDPLNQSTSLAYNSNGTLDTWTDTKQRLTQFFYEDSHKNLTRILDPKGGQTFLGYDANGNLVSAQDPDGRTTLMEYDGKNRLIRVEDALGHETHLDFDAAGNLVLITDAKGRETRLYYNSLNRLYKIKDPLQQEVLLGYDATGRLNQVTDALGRMTGLSYDAVGRRTEVLLPDQQKVLLAYNAINRLVSITSPNGARSDLGQIQVEGALNILDNPAIEIESIAADYGNRPQHWNHSEDWAYSGGAYVLQSSNGPNPKPKPRSSAEAHSGSYSLELETGQNWSQREIPSHAGGRYLAKGWAKKGQAGAATVVTSLAGVVRNFQAELETQVTPSQETSVATTWTELKPQLVQIPGDTQASRTKPPLARLELHSQKAASEDPNSPTYFDDLSLSLLSTCAQYDGKHLREITSPDGARFVRDFDRFGRLSRLTDPQGRWVSFHYDSLGRLIKVRDSLGHSLVYGYDATSQLVSFTDARGQVMTFGFDELDRLESITYPDSSQELFTYSPAGDILTYRDNQSRLRSFSYDWIHRLTQINYPGGQTLLLGYDEVSNLTSRTERNGDQELHTYDALDRLSTSRLLPASASTSWPWELKSEYDAVGNRKALGTQGAIYGESHYGEGHYRLWPYWSVPNNGRDAMNRMLIFIDSQGHSNSVSYDVEGRRTQLAPSNGTLTSAAYDIVGKLLSLTTVKDSQELLKLAYDYNQASDRLGQLSDKASSTYHLDRSGRLVQETTNRWVTQYNEYLGQGELEGCLLDSQSQRIQLLGVSDTFSQLHLDRWTLKFQQRERGLNNQTGQPARVMAPPQTTGMRLRADQGLHMLFPSAWMSLNYPAKEVFQMVHDEVGNLLERSLIQNLELKRTLTGDFDLVLEWDGFDIPTVGSPLAYYPFQCFLQLNIEPLSGGSFWLQRRFDVTYRTLPKYPNLYQWSYNNATCEKLLSNPSAHQAGKFRFKRSNDAFELYYWDAPTSTWKLCCGSLSSGFSTGEVRLSLSGECFVGSLQFRLSSLSHLGSNPANFPSNPGRYTSVAYDAGQSVAWTRLAWEETLPANTDVRVQVACSNSLEGPWSYRGPDGTSNTYFTTPSGETLPVGANFTGRYARYQVTLSSSNGLSTPSFGNLHLSFGGGGMLASSSRIFAYDPAGNLQTVTTTTDSGTTVDDRNPAANPINNLNQIKGRVVGGATWSYSYDLNGNLTGKSNGTQMWTYTWSDENRLTRVQGPGVDVSYTYDSIGRMLTRTQAGVVTHLIWQEWNCIREVSNGTNIVYHIPDGTLHSFSLKGKVYQCHLDALGSVRMITDEAGAVVGRFEYGAWGEEVFASVSPALAGFAYRFVGGLGVRTDSVTGLVYMRNRWYDPGLMRFVSRDPIGLMGGQNLYYYPLNPVNQNDPRGLGWERGDSHWTQQEVDSLREALLPILQNERCRDAIKKLRGIMVGKCSKEVPEDLDRLIELTQNVTFAKMSQSRIRNESGYNDSAGYLPDKKVIEIGPDLVAGSERAKELIFHELLHVLGGWHSVIPTPERNYYFEMFLEIEAGFSFVTEACGFSNRYSNLNYSGRALYDYVRHGTPVSREDYFYKNILNLAPSVKKTWGIP